MFGITYLHMLSHLITSLFVSINDIFYTCMPACIPIHTYIPTYLHTYLHTYVPPCLAAYKRTYVHTFACTCICRCVGLQCMHQKCWFPHGMDHFPASWLKKGIKWARGSSNVKYIEVDDFKRFSTILPFMHVFPGVSWFDHDG